MHMICFVLPNYIRYWYSMGATACTTTNGIKTEVVKRTCPHCPDTSCGIQEKNRVVRMLQAGVFTKHGLANAEPIPIKHKTRQWTSNNGINYSEEMWIIKWTQLRLVYM